MRNSEEQKYRVALGMGIADIFFILLSFFLVLTLAAERAKKEELLFKLPFYSGKAATQPKLSPWKVMFTKDWSITNSDTVLWVESDLSRKPFETGLRPPSKEFASALLEFFTQFMDEEKRMRDVSRIPGFDIYADYATPYGAVFEVTAACSKVGKIHSIIYRELD